MAGSGQQEEPCYVWVRVWAGGSRRGVHQVWGDTGQWPLRLPWVDTPTGTPAGAAVLTQHMRPDPGSASRSRRTVRPASFCRHARVGHRPPALGGGWEGRHVAHQAPSSPGAGFTSQTSSCPSGCRFDSSQRSGHHHFACLGFLTSDLGWQKAGPTHRRGQLCSVLVRLTLVV